MGRGSHSGARRLTNAHSRGMQENPYHFTLGCYVRDTEERSNRRRVGKAGKTWRGRGWVSILRSNDLGQGRREILIIHLILTSVICEDDSVAWKDDYFNSVWCCMKSTQQQQRKTKETGVETAGRGNIRMHTDFWPEVREIRPHVLSFCWCHDNNTALCVTTSCTPFVNMDKKMRIDEPSRIWGSPLLNAKLEVFCTFLQFIQS